MWMVQVSRPPPGTVAWWAYCCRRPAAVRTVSCTSIGSTCGLLLEQGEASIAAGLAGIGVGHHTPRRLHAAYRTHLTAFGGAGGSVCGCGCGCGWCRCHARRLGRLRGGRIAAGGQQQCGQCRVHPSARHAGFFLNKVRQASRLVCLRGVLGWAMSAAAALGRSWEHCGVTGKASSRPRALLREIRCEVRACRSRGSCIDLQRSGSRLNQRRL